MSRGLAFLIGRLFGRLFRSTAPARAASLGFVRQESQHPITQDEPDGDDRYQAGQAHRRRLEAEGLKGINVEIVGTGFEGRANVIRKHCRPGMPVMFASEPLNPHDPNAISVWITTGHGESQIGYIAAKRAVTWTKRLASGEADLAGAAISTMYAPPDVDFPRVSVVVQFRDKKRMRAPPS